MDDKAKLKKLNEIKDMLFELYPKAKKIDIRVDRDGKIIARPNEEYTEKVGD